MQLLFDANQEIKDEGVGDETAAGGQKMGAAVKAREKYISQLIRLSVILKLNPGSRVQVAKSGAGGASAVNEFEGF